ncbi:MULTISPECIES: hypothetical protein [unclassified Streptomyces]|uniref:hypothetical protein n=1 Tax=unclassified Streptomyces TaxID=2593676 RepID=UPI0033B92195
MSASACQAASIAPGALAVITDNGPTEFENFDYTIDVNAIVGRQSRGGGKIKKIH